MSIIMSISSIKTHLYQKLKSLVTTKYGIGVMLILCFLESCVSPVTPLVMLIPIILIHQDKALRYINLATLAAVLGSILGYLLGDLLIDYVKPLIDNWGYTKEFIDVQAWFAKYGLLVLLPASILPFPPFKVFTIAAGAMKVNFFYFVIVAAIVRWLHFVIIPLMIKFGKQAYLYKYENKLVSEQE